MTIAVGLLCDDGIVIGSDSSATFTAGSLRTIEQPTKKIQILCGEVILAGSGSVGLGQRFAAEVELCLKNKECWKSKALPIGIAKALCQKAMQNFQSTNLQRIDYSALVAFPLEHNLYLCEFQEGNFQPELKTADLWYVSIGGGQSIADPFLGFMRRVFWKNSPPKLSEGIFAVTWVLHHTIDVNPGGIKDPMSVAVLEKGTLKARFIQEAELLEHQQNVTAVEEYLSKYADILGGRRQEVTSAVPELPKLA